MTARPSTPDRAAAAAVLPDRIAFLGLGLIGGSVALALRDAGYRGRISAWTPAGTGPALAARDATIDAAAVSARDAVEGARLVVLAGPPTAVLEDLARVVTRDGALASDATLTDVASTKAEIGARADTLGVRFVGGHPMAGRETTGFGAATADLFVDRPWVVVPGAAASALDIARVEALAHATGAHPVRVGAEEHDTAVAAISHLPLVLAASLVEAVALGPEAAATWPLARQLAAGGWRDMTRLARGDSAMGAGILATNAGPVADQLRAVRAVLDEWIARLEASAAANDTAAIDARLQAARSALEDGLP